MSQAVEDCNRRMLRARDAMDRTYAQPLDIPYGSSLRRSCHRGANSSIGEKIFGTPVEDLFRPSP